MYLNIQKISVDLKYYDAPIHRTSKVIYAMYDRLVVAVRLAQSKRSRFGTAIRSAHQSSV